MVHTRNQKRSFEIDNVQGNADDNTNVKMTSKKRKPNSQAVEVPNSSGNKPSSDEESDDGPSYVTQTDEDEIDGDEIDDESEDEQDSDNCDGDNGNFSNDVIKDIITRVVADTLSKKINHSEITSDENEEDNEEHDNKENDEDKKKNPYKAFMRKVDSIYSGDFFTRVPMEDKLKQLKKHVSDEEIEKLNNEIEFIREYYKMNAPSIVDIIKMDITMDQKLKLLEKLYHYTNSEMLTSEYTSNLKSLLNSIKKSADPELLKLEQEVLLTAQSDEFSDDYKRRVLKSEMSFENKVIAYKKADIMETYEQTDSSEFAKYKSWMDSLLSIPFNKYINTPCLEEVGDQTIKDYIQKVRNTLDRRLSFLEKPKDQIINIVTQMVRNPDFTMNAIGLHGSAGLGKTDITKSIAEALGRPYKSISLGGESDASLLTGHGFTYVGSCPGRLIEVLRESKCMNPVVLIDEVDKISETHHGKEIVGTLIHLTDTTTNKKYNYDKYFSGIEFDLSKVLFVFTYNDPEKVDKILSDRLFKIKVDNYTKREKLEIAEKHLIKNILRDYNFTDQDVKVEKEAMEYIVEHSHRNEGMRDIKRKLQIIVSRINTLMLTTGIEEIVKLKYRKLAEHFKCLPVIVRKEHVDTLLEESMTQTPSDDPPPHMYI